MAELGRSLAVEPFLACAVVAGHVLSQLEDRSAGGSAIEEIMAAGRVVTVLAHDAGADPFATPQTVATARGGRVCAERSHPLRPTRRRRRGVL
jgi:hypothetical protein